MDRDLLITIIDDKGTEAKNIQIVKLPMLCAVEKDLAVNYAIGLVSKMKETYRKRCVEQSGSA